MSYITQSLDRSRYLKVGLEDVRYVILLLFANQSERSFQSRFSGCTIFTFHFNIECIVYAIVYAMRDHLLLVSYDACGTNQEEAQLFVAILSRDYVEV